MENDSKLYAGRLLKISEVASILNVDSATVRRWCADGRVNAIYYPKRPGGTRRAIRIKGESIDKILGNS